MKKIQKLILLAIPIGFYLFFAFFDGPVICVDSPTYIDMSLSREPFYSSFLAILRLIFGIENDLYLKVAVIVQGLLTGLCTFSFVKFIYEESKCRFQTALLMIAVCLGTSIVCRFLAQRGSMYSTCIMTESICIPLFLLFSKQVLSYVMYRKRKDLILSAVITFILITTRKQMYIALFLLVISMLFTALRDWAKGKKKIGCGILSAIIVTVCVLLANKAFEYTYSNVISGSTYSHFNDNRFLTTMVFYVSEQKDGNYIEDTHIRNLFDEIYAICDSEGSMMHSAEGTLVERIQHFGDHYDMIQINHMWPMMERYVAELKPGISPIEREQLVDAISNEMAWNILPHVWTRVMRVFLQNMLQGLVNTVGKATISVMYPYAMAVLVVYLILLIILFKERKYSFELLFSLYTLVAFLLNDGLVSVLIFCQVRYMIYIMPLFYIALLLLIRATLFRNRN